MTIQDFVLEAQKAVIAHFRENGTENIEVRTAEVVKANDTRVHGLMLLSEEDGTGRSIYIDDLFDMRESGGDPDHIIYEIISRCEAGLCEGGPPAGAALELDFESIRPRLTVRLLGVRNNISYMAGRPYIDVGNGLALIAVINSEPSVMSEWVISVTDSLMKEHIGCDRETLLTEALKNTMEIEPPQLVSLDSHMYANLVRAIEVPDYLKQPVEPERLSGAFMLSNRSLFYGAAALFYPGVMERIAGSFGCGYYVLPSSVHELIILPDVTEPDTEELRATVREANTTVLSRDELLSWEIFHYDPSDGRLRTVREEQHIAGYSFLKGQKCDNIEQRIRTDYI